MRFGLVVDNPRRDLSGLILVARELRALGQQAVLLPMYVQGYESPLLGLDAVLLNYFRPVNYGLAQGYHQAGLGVFVLDTEGGVLSESGVDSPDRWAEFVRSSGCAEVIDGYFFWGDRV